MAVKTAEQLKALFVAGKYPTAADYADLIDTLFNSGGGITKTTTSSSVNLYSDNDYQNANVGDVVMIINDSSYDTINVTVDDNSTIYTIANNGAAMFVKKDSSSWAIIGVPIQQGGDNGNLGN